MERGRRGVVLVEPEGDETLQWFFSKPKQPHRRPRRDRRDEARVDAERAEENERGVRKVRREHRHTAGGNPRLVLEVRREAQDQPDPVRGGDRGLRANASLTSATRGHSDHSIRSAPRKERKWRPVKRADFHSAGCRNAA